jgi:alkyl sulfatase BDS1-like metallo-beta-lactamase superfamily hydrolase
VPCSERSGGPLYPPCTLRNVAARAASPAGLRVSFRRDRFANLTETYEVTIDDETFTIEVRDGGVEIRPGTATDPSIRLHTDAGTFVALLTGELTASDALAGDRAALEGERKTLARFIQAFAFGPAASG